MKIVAKGLSGLACVDWPLYRALGIIWCNDIMHGHCVQALINIASLLAIEW